MPNTSQTPSTHARAALFLAVFAVLLALALAFDARYELKAARDRETALTRTVIELEKRVTALENGDR